MVNICGHLNSSMGLQRALWLGKESETLAIVENLLSYLLIWYETYTQAIKILSQRETALDRVAPWILKNHHFHL